MIEYVAFAILGLVMAVVSVEYARWRLGYNKAMKELLKLLGITDQQWREVTGEERIKLIGERLQAVWKTMFPETGLPAPSPSKVLTMRGNEFFIPKCPRCNFLCAPIMKPALGIRVESNCPMHGRFIVMVPEESQ